MSAAAVLRDVVGLLDRRGTPYAVLGGFAVRTHGIPRPTYDVDVMIEIDQEQRSQLLDDLSAAGFEVPEAYRSGWSDQVRGMPILKLKTYRSEGAIAVDLFLAENQFQQEAMKRRARASSDELDLWCVSAEDLVLLKLLADRARDRSDVGDVFFIQGTLDLPYLRRWAAKLGIADRLERAIREADDLAS